METRWKPDGNKMETRWKPDGNQMETRWKPDGNKMEMNDLLHLTVAELEFF